MENIYQSTIRDFDRAVQNLQESEKDHQRSLSSLKQETVVINKEKDQSQIEEKKEGGLVHSKFLLDFSLEIILLFISFIIFQVLSFLKSIKFNYKVQANKKIDFTCSLLLSLLQN